MSLHVHAHRNMNRDEIVKLLQELEYLYSYLMDYLQQVNIPVGKRTCTSCGTGPSIEIEGNIIAPRPFPSLFPPREGEENKKSGESERVEERRGRCRGGQIGKQHQAGGGSGQVSVEVGLSEEIRERLGTVPKDVIPEKLAEELEKSGTVLQEGQEQEVPTGDWWKRRIVEIVSSMKSAGVEPGELARWLERLLRPVVNWREVLRSAIGYGVRRLRIEETWTRPHRKAPEIFPGRIKYPAPTVWCLVDTSGSINDRELAQFASEIYNIMQTYRTPVRVIFWDSAAYGPYTLPFTSNPQEFVELYRKFVKGGGGTVIGPALGRLLKNMKKRDIVVIFTDADIADLENPDVQRALDLISRLASSSVFVTTYRDYVPPGRWIRIRIRGLTPEI